jgi:hypothetical protein
MSAASSQELSIEAFSHFGIIHRGVLESKRMLQLDLKARRRSFLLARANLREPTRLLFLFGACSTRGC